MELSYDAELLTLTAAAPGAVMTCVDTSRAGIVRIGYADAAVVDAVVATLTFAVNTDTTAETALTLTTLEDCSQTPNTAEATALEVPGHSYTSVVTPPTADAQGYTTHTCVNCGHVYVDGYTAIIASGWSGYTTWTLTDTGILTVSPTEQKLENGRTNMKNYWKVKGVLTLPWSGYADQIVEVVIADGVHELGQMAFYELPNLRTVTLGKDVIEVRGYTFKNCTSLTTINLEGVKFIREGAFYGCTALENVTFAEDVTIEDWAFTRTNIQP